MNSAELIKKLNEPVDAGVLVIGDAMLDRYTVCEVMGLSPECSATLKVQPRKVYNKLGGAANVALNLSNLGLKTTLAFALGNDDVSREFVSEIVNTKIDIRIIECTDRPTTLKHRFITGQGRHLMRLDCEVTAPIPFRQDWFDLLFTETKCNDVLVSDYSKGMITRDLMQWLHLQSRDIIVDPKKSLKFYGNVFACTPNQLEFNPSEFLDRCVIPAQRIIHKLSGDGCDLYLSSSRPQRFPVNFKQVGDPSGCGDSFLAGFMLGKALKLKMADCCRLGNAAGAVSFTKQGVYAVTVADLQEELASFEYGE